MLKDTFAIATLLSAVSASGSRTMTFHNYCQETVYFGFAGGSAQSKNG